MKKLFTLLVLLACAFPALGQPFPGGGAAATTNIVNSLAVLKTATHQAVPSLWLSNPFEITLESTNYNGNVLMIQNSTNGGYSAIRFRDSSGAEVMAIGYGNSKSPIYTAIPFLEYDVTAGFWFVNAGNVICGVGSDGGTKGFEVLAGGQATNDTLHMVARMGQDGKVVGISHVSTAGNTFASGPISLDVGGGNGTGVNAGASANSVEIGANGVKTLEVFGSGGALPNTAKVFGNLLVTNTAAVLGSTVPNVPYVLWRNINASNNVGSSVDTWIYSNSIPANTFANNGSRMEGKHGLQRVSATEARIFKLWVAGTALTVYSASQNTTISEWEYSLVRSNNTTLFCNSKWFDNGILVNETGTVFTGVDCTAPITFSTTAQGVTTATITNRWNMATVYP